jgi:hypothetical protein
VNEHGAEPADLGGDVHGHRPEDKPGTPLPPPRMFMRGMGLCGEGEAAGATSRRGLVCE